MTESPADQRRRQRLRRMKLRATGLLVIAAIVYLCTWRATRSGWLGFANAGAEAAMVGGLADWFAVVAIFRHPLGLKTKHTALIARHKDKVGKALESFVTDNFLTEELIREKVASADVALLGARWLDDPAHRSLIIDQLTKTGRSGLAKISDDDISSLLRDTLTPKLEQKQFAPLVGSFLAGIVKDDAHRGLIDLLTRELHEWLSRNPEQFRAIVSERMPSWAPRWADRRFHDWAYQHALSWARDVRDQPRHQVRQALDSWLTKLAINLKTNTATQAHADQLKASILSNPQLGVTLTDIWQSARASIDSALIDHDSALWLACDRWLRDIAVQVEADPEFHTKVNHAVENGAAYVTNQYGTQIVSIISTQVDRWDPEQASERIELFVGPDLQWIRINGTAVGCLVGLAIYSVSWALSMLH
ncbi:MAG: DUF445 domain-containing protein [Propionibacteriaceae bacterium]